MRSEHALVCCFRRLNHTVGLPPANAGDPVTTELRFGYNFTFADGAGVTGVPLRGA